MFDFLFSDQLNVSNIAKPDTDVVHCLQLFPVVINSCEHKLELWEKKEINMIGRIIEIINIEYRVNKVVQVYTDPCGTPQEMFL